MYVTLPLVLALVVPVTNVVPLLELTALFQSNALPELLYIFKLGLSTYTIPSEVLVEFDEENASKPILVNFEFEFINT